MRVFLLIAAVSGFLCVAIGAFGAHGVQDARARELIETGVRYQMFHTLALLALAALLPPEGVARWAGAAFVAGMLLFSGSLYGLAFGAPRMAGAITPIGGLFFLIGWALAAFAFFKRA